MGAIIDLLSNLFKLTKVAAVTLPGLAAAGALALLFWLPPVDVIPIAEPKFLSSERTSGIQQELPCPSVPGEPIDSSRASCQPLAKVEDTTGKPACQVKQFILSDLNDCDDCAKKATPENPVPQDTSSRESDWDLLSHAGLDPHRLLLDQSTRSSTYIVNPQARTQYLLDFEKDQFAACAEVEDSRKGMEEQENALFTTDIANLDKQRSDIQDAYTSFLKSNNPAADGLRRKLQLTLDKIEWTREKSLRNSSSIKQRQLRSDELKRDANIISDRLLDPGRLRPRKTFDDYLSGLVNHVVGFILLSLALSLVVTAIDRAAFDSIYEILFTSSRLEAPATEQEDHRKWANVLRKLGWDMLIWVSGLVIIAILCTVLYCVPGYVVRKLLAASVAGLTGVSLGHWWVRWQQEKGITKTSSRYSVGKLVSMVVTNQPEQPELTYQVRDLGFFNKRLAMRDPRLLPASKQANPARDAGSRELKTPPPQILQPRYAIGKGIITQAEYQDLKDSYFAQSELSFGLILPLFLLVFALGKQQMQLCMPAWTFCFLLGLEILLTFALFWAGMERQEKFGMEFRMLILGHWDKLNEAAETSGTSKPKPDLSDLRTAVKEELSKMQMQVKPLVVELRSEPTPQPKPTTQKPPQGEGGPAGKP